MAAENAFPNTFELEVASALLLLSTAIPDPLALISINLEKSSCKREKVMMMMMNDKTPTRLSVSRSNWSSSSSSITSDNPQPEKVITIITRFHDKMMKLKAVRKRRSKTFCISDCRKINSEFPETEVEASASASSCVSSSSSSAISSGRSCDVIRKREHLPVLTRAKKDSKPKQSSYSGHMRRRAEAILKVLTTQGSVSEVRIRHLLGDNPSTSKALRILLNLEKVKRTGAGGRSDPYIYTEWDPSNGVG